MTRYTVVWTRSAQEQLAELWLAADDRNQISATVATIDELLASDAPERGKPLHEGLRVLEMRSFKVLFAVLENDRVVEVGGVVSHSG